jgi:hypothetical protein
MAGTGGQCCNAHRRSARVTWIVAAVSGQVPDILVWVTIGALAFPFSGMNDRR